MPKHGNTHTHAHANAHTQERAHLMNMTVSLNNYDVDIVKLRIDFFQFDIILSTRDNM